MTSSTVPRPSTAQGFSRFAASLASTTDAESRLERRVVVLTIASRWVTIGTGLVLGLFKGAGEENFALAAALLVAFASLVTFQQLHKASLHRIHILTLVELALTVGVIMITGAFRSPFILTPITGLLLAGYIWGRRATVGTAFAGAIAAIAAIAIQSADNADQRQSSQIAIVFMLCGALGAFTRNLAMEIEAQRAAAIDQATQMATANDLLVSLHRLAQTLPASFDLGEVVESIRQRVRALFPYTALVVLVPDDAGATWRAELAEGVRVPARFAERELPQPLHRAMISTTPVVVEDRISHSGSEGFAALARSGLYTALRARGALVGLVAIEHEPPGVYGTDEQELLQSLSSVLALSLDNARWFGRLHTLGAELWRIVQEALANVDRHSSASRVVVRWLVDEHGARLEVADDGKGFDPGGVEGDHYGIVGMRERADAIGGRLSIVSRPDHGTSVVVELEAAASPRRPVRKSA